MSHLWDARHKWVKRKYFFSFKSRTHFSRDLVKALFVPEFLLFRCLGKAVHVLHDCGISWEFSDIFMMCRKSNRKVQKLSPLYKMVEKIPRVSINLNSTDHTLCIAWRFYSPTAKDMSWDRFLLGMAPQLKLHYWVTKTTLWMHRLVFYSHIKYLSTLAPILNFQNLLLCPKLLRELQNVEAEQTSKTANLNVQY